MSSLWRTHNYWSSFYKCINIMIKTCQKMLFIVQNYRQPFSSTLELSTTWKAGGENPSSTRWIIKRLRLNLPQQLLDCGKSHFAAGRAESRLHRQKTSRSHQTGSWCSWGRRGSRHWADPPSSEPCPWHSTHQSASGSHTPAGEKKH